MMAVLRCLLARRCTSSPARVSKRTVLGPGSITLSTGAEVAKAPGDLAFSAVRCSGQRRCRYRPALAEEAQERERERRIVAGGKRALQGASERFETVDVAGVS